MTGSLPKAIVAFFGALVRNGRALRNWQDFSTDGPTGSAALDRALFLALQSHQKEKQHTLTTPPPFEGNDAFMRFGRSLYDAGAEVSSSILRAQRGILQQEQPMIIIDADDGQLMRYGRR